MTLAEVIAAAMREWGNAEPKPALAPSAYIAAAVAAHMLDKATVERVAVAVCDATKYMLWGCSHYSQCNDEANDRSCHCRSQQADAARAAIRAALGAP